MKGKYTGYSYTTVHGNVLTAGEYSTRNQKGRYTISCSVCSEDTELFPTGSIETSGDSVREKRCVCGCGSGYRYTEDQYKIRIKRRCVEESYIFNGFVGKYKDYTTKLNLYNPATGNSWNTTNIQTFLLNGVRDPVVSLESSIATCTKSDDYFITNFMSTGRFLEGTEFYRHEGSRWSYTCPKCSFDEFVQNGVCSGVFEAYQGHLSGGKLSCRCDRWKSTPEQVRYLIEKKLKEVGGTFLRWIGKNRTKRNGKFKWVCKEGHFNDSPVTYFLKTGNCKTCFANGFKNYLPAYLYIVRWASSDGTYSCLKYGITTVTIKSRIANQKAKSEMLPTVLYSFYHENGKVVEDCEKTLKLEVGSHFCKRELLPRGFSETVDDTKDNLLKLTGVVERYSLKLMSNTP